MQYLIEARELTSEYSHRASFDAEPRPITVEAVDAGEAISRFVTQNRSELVSFVSPRGVEGIATVRKDDAVYLVRVYAA